MENEELIENSVVEEHMVKGGLVLEGGGMRGLYTAGVLDYFLEQGLLSNKSPVVIRLRRLQ